MAGEAADAVDVGVAADVAAEVATEASIVSHLLCYDFIDTAPIQAHLRPMILSRPGVPTV